MKTILVVLAALSGALPSVASTVVFSDFQANALACQCSMRQGDALGASPSAFDPVTIGDPFTVPMSASFTLDAADMALWLYSGSPSPVQVSLYADANGAPNALLASTLITGPLPAWNQDAPPVTADFLQHPILNAGQTYWLVATTTDPETEAGWWSNNASVTGMVYIHDTIYAGPSLACCTHDELLDTFDIIGTPLTAATPETQSWVLVLIGIILMLPTLNRRSSRRGVSH